MSNPGVVFLLNTNIGSYQLVVEDNIGEAIHIHFGNLRCDLTINEFRKLVLQLNLIMKEMVGKNLNHLWGDDDFNNLHVKHLLKGCILSEKQILDSVAVQKEKIRKKVQAVMTNYFPKLLEGKRILIKGAGEHTEKLIELWGNSVDIRGVVANDNLKSLQIRFVTAVEEELNDYDVVVISSFIYRKEMKKEMIKYGIPIIDIYEYFDALDIPMQDAFYKFK